MKNVQVVHASDSDPELSVDQMAEGISAKLRGKRLDKFNRDNEKLAEQYGKDTPEYQQWVFENYIREVLGVKDGNPGLGLGHVHTGSSRKPGSHASSRHG